MAGYSKTPLWKKLGMREADKLPLLDAPAKWQVPELPSGVTSTGESARGGDESPVGSDPRPLRVTSAGGRG